MPSCGVGEWCHVGDVPESHLNHVLRAAIGWFELGSYGEALGELDRLAVGDRNRTETLELRAVILQQMDRWDDAAQAYTVLCGRDGAPVDRFIAWGCCLYELGRVPECRLALLSAPDEARSCGLWNFHLACYESILGNKSEARRLVHECLRLEPLLREMVLRNENLAPLVEA